MGARNRKRRGEEYDRGIFNISDRPGPQGKKHWALAKQHGLKTIAKIQAGNTWEIAAVPYIPAVENAAQHAANLKKAQVDGLMLGWTLGGYPSPNLEVVAAMGSDAASTPLAAMQQVAASRFGAAGNAVVKAWQAFSTAFKEFPYHSSTVYFAPLQMGPANLLWQQPTGYAATMVGLPYDDVKKWIGNYPAPVFISQLRKVSTGFNEAIRMLKQEAEKRPLQKTEKASLLREIDVAQVVALHYASVANQVEIRLAKELVHIQLRDSRIGFEATNHYFYTPADLVEKIINCRVLLKEWLLA
jgi:hypothetical protein